MVLRGFGTGQGNRFWVIVIVVVFTVVFVAQQVRYLHLEETKHVLEKTVGALKEAKGEREDGKDSRKFAGDKDTVVIYNRIPKTASTSFVNVAYDLCRRNGFNVLHLNVTANSHVMSIADQARFVYNLSHWEAKKPGLYHGHIAYIDFEKFGSSQRPVYINLIRKPLDRLVSYYYFLRYGDNYRPHLVRRKHGDKTSFDDCVRLQQAACSPESMWLQIPFICGHAPDCWVPGSRWALEEAKRNLLDRYLLVGVTEELADFIAILQSALPSFFKGATDHFRTSKKAHLRKTNQKFEPSEETVRTIQRTAVWQMENEFYQFALEQFHQVKKRMGTNREGQVLDRGQQFMFEKISPK